MSSTSLLFNFLKGRDTVSQHLGVIAARAQATSSAINGMGKVGKIMYAAFAVVVAGAAAQVMAFTAAIGPMLNIVAALPATLFAAASGVLALVIGFRHFGAALKNTASGAGRSGEAIAAAERRVEQAQRAALKAQQAVNDARAEASRRLADMARELARAHLDERAAILSVSDAKRQLREARSTGDRSEVERARIAYEESVLTLEDVRQKLADVTKEDEQRRKAGVEGSTEVQDALERQAEAMQNLADAQAALRSGGGGTDKAAEAYAKLTAEGKALVDVLKSMGKAWSQVRQAVQSAMFRGLAGDVQKLSDRYLPVMKAQLPAIAQGWNNAFRSTAQIAATAGFVKDMNTSLGQAASLWQKVGSAFAPFLSGFRHWIVIGSSFFPRLGAWVERMGQSFDRWSEAQRKTGRGFQWIERALEVGHQFNGMLGSIREATFELFKASMSPGLIEGLTAGAQGFANFIKSAEGQQRVTHLFTELKAVWSQAWIVLKQFLDLMTRADFSGVVGGLKILNAVLAFLGEHMDAVNWALRNLLPIYIAHRTIVTANRVALIAWRVAFGTAQYYVKALGVAMKFLNGAVNLVSLAFKKQTYALIANKAALIGQRIATAAMVVWAGLVKVATIAWTAVQWLLNASLWANPIGVIILIIGLLIAAIAATVVGIIWLVNNWDKAVKWMKDGVQGWWLLLKLIGAWFAGPFVNFFINAWNWIKNAFKTAVDWVVEKFMWLVNLPKELGKKVGAAARGMWDGLVMAFKTAINTLILLWNNFHLTLGGGSILGIDIPEITLNTPDIPYLKSGGDIRSEGVAYLHAGERVLNAAEVKQGGNAGGVQTLRIEFAGDREMLRLIRKIVKDNGGDVQTVFG